MEILIIAHCHGLIDKETFKYSSLLPNFRTPLIYLTLTLTDIIIKKADKGDTIVVETTDNLTYQTINSITDLNKILIQKLINQLRKF